MRDFHRLRTLLLVPMLYAGMAAVFATPFSASAGFIDCRGDPIVTLSNGDHVVLTATIKAAVSDVSEVRYALHGPAGTHVTSVVYEGTEGLHETFVYVADTQAGAYWSDTDVTASVKAKVTSDLEVNGESESEKGKTNEHIVVSLDE